MGYFPYNGKLRHSIFGLHLLTRKSFRNMITVPAPSCKGIFMYLGILPQNNGSVVVLDACHVLSSGSHKGEPPDRQRFPLGPQQTCQLHGNTP